MVPEMTSSSLLKSARAARGRPQLATCMCSSANELSADLYGSKFTDWAPEMCACGEYGQKKTRVLQLNQSILKKYSRAAGERAQLRKEAIER